MGMRRAITLVELLVSIAIIAILSGLLLASVQMAREAARRGQCASQMRQLGLSVQGFDSAHRYLPPSNIWRDSPNDPQTLTALGVTPDTGHSWLIFFAPYFDQGNLADQYSRRHDSRSPQNRLARETVLPLVRCPSSAESSTHDSFKSTPFGETSGAVGDYSVCRGLGPSLIKKSQSPWSILLPRKLGTLAAVKDGLSQTLLLGESSGRQAAYVSGRRRVAGHPVSMWSEGVNSVMLNGHTADGLSSPGPCALNCSNRGGFYAFHPGGMNACFGDGSTRFLAQGIDLPVMAALVTRRGGD